MAHTLNRATGKALASPRSTAQGPAPSLKEILSGKHPLSAAQAAAAVVGVLFVALLFAGVTFGVRAKISDGEAYASNVRMMQEESLSAGSSTAHSTASIAQQIEDAKADKSLSEEERQNTVTSLNERQMAQQREAEAQNQPR